MQKMPNKKNTPSFPRRLESRSLFRFLKNWILAGAEMTNQELHFRLHTPT